MLCKHHARFCKSENLCTRGHYQLRSLAEPFNKVLHAAYTFLHRSHRTIPSIFLLPFHYKIGVSHHPAHLPHSVRLLWMRLTVLGLPLVVSLSKYSFPRRTSPVEVKISPPNVRMLRLPPTAVHLVRPHFHNVLQRSLLHLKSRTYASFPLFPTVLPVVLEITFIFGSVEKGPV